ncbi:MarR family winged helix-turn-helix transcriptional regulator [Vagococcus intermedius]|uniref:MarR family transcriptional regulator n=1 Tax=Vagococcus intermedius TaxID=2991418 RepID=A0AAF0CVU4_9ENTE|nr:MarR family transcriptional regulator [Vagococcus intermedius]WEG73627.1 MarR family transcriptional regulator [Vagococcus intermedius]WEG75711.1 MarR family transcriptional regulator [Vagococcus intermedius]
MLYENEDYLKTILLSFRDIHQETRTILNGAAMKKDITIVQLLVANIIKKNPQSTLNQVAKEMRLGKSTVSGIVSRMVNSGYILKEEDPSDRRNTLLSLSLSGEQKVSETYDIYLKNLLPILEIDPEKLADLLTTHQQILTILDEVKHHD